MTADYKRIQQRLQAFDFSGLFTQELMWNRYVTRDLAIALDGATYTLKPVAQRGMAVYECVPPADAQFPKYATRRKIDAQVLKTAREHIIIFHDNAKTVQVWQWVKREAGKPSACREQLFYMGQSGDALVQKIRGIAFGLEDEANVAEAAARVGAVFDVEKVTKKFYDLFKTEHDAFLKFVNGIPDKELEKWYVSVMLNRLMFIYFIQKKGFLGGDLDYLRNKLVDSKRRGKDKFYREFLCPLFFEGFAKRSEQRSVATNSLLGSVPYLNGGLFLRHQIEELHGKSVDIPDKAFDLIFAFFEQYDWHLDDRPTRKGNEINPDVLGYVFEKYINQKEMGAYYSKEDITGYISQNTIIPAIFDSAHKGCRVAFEGEHSVWRLLQEEPDRYFYAVVLHGTAKELPLAIAAGIEDVSKRGDWNKTAPEEYGLPTETWREVVARRQRYKEVRAKLAAGEIQTINDLITYNLDIQRFAEEVISNAEGADLVWAFYKAVEKLSVLDPTCGSGAFLFAALNILEKLYDTCLVRMQAFVDDLDRSEERHSPKKFEHFRLKLAEMNDKARHPSPRYFILKSIILNNLYGVDIMEEATEICKLRLFLKLVAQVNAGDQIEPLPDIDFNIKAGNTLVGFATKVQLKSVLDQTFDFGENRLAEIEERAAQAELAYERFRDSQVQQDTDPLSVAKAKQELKDRLQVLRAELDVLLAGEYGIKKADQSGREKWQKSHQPFHWFAEFYGIIKAGGFDVVIGNPPYVEKRVIEDEYRLIWYSTDSTNNLFAYCSERALALQRPGSRFGFIIPVSSISTEKFTPLQRLFMRQKCVWLSHYNDRPSRLFDGLEHARLTIVLHEKAPVDCHAEVYSTNYRKWNAVERACLFACTSYTDTHQPRTPGSVQKVGTDIEGEILSRVFSFPSTLETFERASGSHVVYYTRKIAGFLNITDFVPEMRDGRNRRREPSELKILGFDKQAEADATFCVLNSTLYRWFATVFGDCRNLNRRDVLSFRLDMSGLLAKHGKELGALAKRLSNSLQSNSEMRKMKFKQETLTVQCIIPRFSKAIIDNIDEVLGPFYGLTEEQLDFIINFDFKYRLGADDEETLADAGAGD